MCALIYTDRVRAVTPVAFLRTAFSKERKAGLYASLHPSAALLSKCLVLILVPNFYDSEQHHPRVTDSSDIPAMSGFRWYTVVCAPKGLDYRCNHMETD